MVFHVAVLSHQAISTRRSVDVSSFSKWHLASASVLFGALVVQLWCRLAVIHAGYDLETERRAALESDRQLRQLKLDEAQVARPAILLARAQRELGLQHTAPSALRRVVDVRK